MNVVALVQLQRPVFPSSFPFLRSFEENHVCSLASGGKENLQVCPGLASRKRHPGSVLTGAETAISLTISEKQYLYVIKDSNIDLSFYSTSLYNVSCRPRWSCSLENKWFVIVEDEFSLRMAVGQASCFWFMWCALQNAVRAASVGLSGHLEPNQQAVSTSLTHCRFIKFIKGEHVAKKLPTSPSR